MLGECFLILSLRKLGLPLDLTCILDAEPGKLDIKRREPGILFISLQVGSISKLARRLQMT